MNEDPVALYQAARRVAFSLGSQFDQALYRPQAIARDLSNWRYKEANVDLSDWKSAEEVRDLLGQARAARAAMLAAWTNVPEGRRIGLLGPNDTR